jgi:transposase InsO family protein
MVSRISVERAMTIQEVILMAMAKKLTWIEASQILGYTDRHMRRVKARYEREGFHGLYDGRCGKLSPRRISSEVVEEVLRLYRDEYFDFNVVHFHEKLVERHEFKHSYTWTKSLLQKSGLAGREPKRGVHRKKRERRPLAGMLLHIDGSEHQWFQDGRWYDLIVIMDDATSEIYYAQLVDEESTRTVMAGIKDVIEKRGIFCALYSDRASHFWTTPKAGEPVDRQALTQVGRALRELGIQMIPAYSPQARGRSERSFGTWQGRLPQELRIRGIVTVEEANRFLSGEYIAEFNRRFAVASSEEGTAFVKCRRSGLDHVFSIQSERIVNRDNTVKFKNMILQIDRQSFRGSLANCRVMVHEHLDETITIGFGPHQVGRFSAEGIPSKQQRESRGNAAAMQNSRSRGFTQPLGKVANVLTDQVSKRLSHIPTASAAIDTSLRILRKGEEPKPDI